MHDKSNHPVAVPLLSFSNCQHVIQWSYLASVVFNQVSLLCLTMMMWNATVLYKEYARMVQHVNAYQAIHTVSQMPIYMV